MQGYNVGSAQQFILADKFVAVLFFQFIFALNIIVLHRCAKSCDQLCYFAADVAQADDTHRFAVNHVGAAKVFRFGPHIVQNLAVDWQQIAVHSQHQHDSQLGSDAAVHAGAGGDRNIPRTPGF